MCVYVVDVCVCGGCVCMWWMCVYVVDVCVCTTVHAQHNAAHCNILQHTATRCSTLQHTVLPCQPIWSTCDVQSAFPVHGSQSVSGKETCMYEKRPTKETCTNEKRPKKETFWLKVVLFTHYTACTVHGSWRVSENETCMYMEKRLLCIKRNLWKRPIDYWKDFWKGLMKWLFWTHMYQKKSMKETYWLFK